MFENSRRGRQARNFTENDPKILDHKSSSEQIIFRNCRWVPLIKANSEHNTPTPDTSLGRANNETSSLYGQPKTRTPQNIITDEEMPESKH